MTGLLYLIVIVMWAAVLFPIFLRRHDQVQVHKAVGLKKQLTALRWQKRVAPTARQQAFIRRRRVLMTLLTATIAILLAGLSGIVPLIWTAAPTVLLLTFVFAAIKNGHKIVAIPDVPAQQLVEREMNIQSAQATVVIALESDAQIPATQAATSTWQPVEPPMPAYVRAGRASAAPRAIDAQKPWTGQDMVEHATRLRQQHAQRIKDAQKRLEEARAVSMEKARRAALSVRPAEATGEQNRAVNE